jgi:MSHA biogenesis protein MshK
MLWALTAAMATITAAAQANLPDPTRPPDRSATAEGQNSSGGAPARSAHRVQSVLISPERKVAVIDGRAVPLGGRVDGARVVAITETGVTLERNGQKETLRINPGVDVKAVAQ